MSEENAPLNRAAFESRKRKTEPVTLDGGGTVSVRKLSESEVETLKKQYGTDDKALSGFRFIVARCVVDGDGTRVFSDDDMSKPIIADMEFDDVQTIASEVIEFSGLNKKKKD